MTPFLLFLMAVSAYPLFDDEADDDYSVEEAQQEISFEDDDLDEAIFLGEEEEE